MNKEHLCVRDDIYFSLYKEFSKIELLPIDRAFELSSLNYAIIDFNGDQLPTIDDISTIYSTPPNNHTFTPGNTLAIGSNGIIISDNDTTYIEYLFEGIPPGTYELRFYAGNANDSGNGLINITAVDTLDANILATIATMEKTATLTGIVVADYETELTPGAHTISSLDSDIILRFDGVFNNPNNIKVRILPQNNMGNLVIGGTIVLMKYDSDIQPIPFGDKPL